MYYPPRKDFLINYTQEESDTVRKHFNYLKKLNIQGIVQFAGRVEDARFGNCLLNVDDKAKAQEIMINDPAVKAKVFSAELLPFGLALPE
jgi:uncharacterized protein YciI